MKLLIVTEYYPPKVMGGGELSAALLAKNLAGAGIDVCVLTSWFKGQPEREISDDVLVYRRLATSEKPDSILSNLKRRTLFYLSSMREVRALDRTIDFDIIHCMNITSMVGVSMANLRKPCVATINSYASLCPKSNMFYKDKVACQFRCSPLTFADCVSHSNVIGISKMPGLLKFNPLFWLAVYSDYLLRFNAMKKMGILAAVSSAVDGYLRKYGIKKRISIIPHIVDVKPAPKKGVKKKGFTILSLSALEPQKGIIMLFKAFPEIKGKIPDARIMLAGTGSMEKELKEYVVSHGFQNGVEFLGKVPYSQTPDLYASADVVVQLSSIPEPLSRIGIEALKLGKPLVATDTGGNRDVVREKTGFLVKDEKELAEAIIKVHQKKTSKNVILRHARQFQNEKIIDKYLSVYEELLRTG